MHQQVDICGKLNMKFCHMIFKAASSSGRQPKEPVRNVGFEAFK